MKRSILAALIFSGLACAQLVERVGTTGFIKVEAGSFEKLPPRERALAYWLNQAAIAVDPIIYDQQSRFGLRQKRVLEGIVSHPTGIDPATLKRISDYTKLFWANRGNHNENTAQKFLPEFSFDDLKKAGLTAIRNGAPLGTSAQFTKEIAELQQSMFDPEFEPMMTAKSPSGGRDILQSSANNFYSNVSLADLKGFTERYPLNSRLVKRPDGKLIEEVYRTGTPDGKVKPGLYAQYLRKANEFLTKAKPLADAGQAAAISALIRYYETGEFSDWLAFGAAWVQSNPRVDFANGFIEVYRDARGAKGTAQAFVSITDEQVNQLMQKLAQRAQYFEDQAPWAAEFKKKGVTPPAAKAVETVMETADFHVGTIGDNLPNEREIHEKYGTKSFLFTGSSRALEAASGNGMLEEFAANPAEVGIVSKYGTEAGNLMTALHEIIGHGSGQLSPKLKGDPAAHLKEYFSALEEARADLMALWNITDPNLQKWGVVSNPNVAKAMYYNAARAPLAQLRRIPKGDTIEEDHMRDRALIVNFIADKTGSIHWVTRNGKTSVEIEDFDGMRKGVGMLLSELMRIKAEGDYPAAKALMDQYGVHFDPKLRDQVIQRYKALNLPTYWAGINSILTPAFDGKGEVKDVKLSYPRDVVDHYLYLASMYEPKLRK